MPKFIDNTDPKQLSDLLSDINRGQIALPDFQRDFVWEPSATKDLIVSAANSYPAGSLLLVGNPADTGMFALREFEGAPALSNPAHLVLDGQQRLTSLYQAFYGKGDHRYFLNLRELLEGSGEFEVALSISRANSREAKKWEALKAQAEDLMMPLSIFQNGKAAIFKWAADIAPKCGVERKVLDEMIDRVHGEWVEAINDYQFPVVILKPSTPPDAICTIFETLNRSGVKLTVFELLTARFWPRDVNLRELWDNAQSERPIVKEFKVDPYYVLQIISLAFRDHPSCKRGDVLGMDMGENFPDRWRQAVESLAQSLAFLKEECGVKAKKWLPYSTMLIPLAAVWVKNSNDMESADAAHNRAKLACWFWCSVFGQRYDSSPNSHALDDFRSLTAWIDDDESVPTSVSKFEFNPDLLRDTFRQRSALYCGVMCLLMNRDAQDFHTSRTAGGVLSSSDPADKIDDHHIFPDGYLKCDEKWGNPKWRASAIACSTGRLSPPRPTG